MAKKTPGNSGFIREIKSRIEPVATTKQPFSWAKPVVKPEARYANQTIKRMESHASVESDSPKFVTEHKQNRSSKK